MVKQNLLAKLLEGCTAIIDVNIQRIYSIDYEQNLAP